MPVSRSSAEVAPQFREFERFTTALLNAFVGPRLRNYLARLAASPQVKAEHQVPGMGTLVEESRFDGAVDHVRKTMRLDSGEVLEAEFHIRYYQPAALAALAYVAGLRLARLHEPLTETTPQLIALLEK